MTRPITMHALQPKHTKLKSEEIKSLLERYNISVSQLPKIRIDDAALPQGCMVSDVIKIERVSMTAGTAVYYRVVVNG